MNQQEQDELMGIISRLLPDSACNEPTDIHALAGGGNNRLFKVDAPGGPVVLKRYFRHSGDQRNRLDSEYRFSEFLWKRGVHCIPEPLARDDSSGTGVYRYVDGNMIKPTDVADQHVNTVLSFLSKINEWHRDVEALTVANASEACFTLEHHLALVQQRVQRLLNLPHVEGTQGKAADLVSGRLLPVWNSVHSECLRRVKETKQDLEEPLTVAERILSPSDLGFHNALQTPQGLVFHDFEYAGWDDPAKTVCDFFCQIAVPMPISYWREVSCGVAQLTQSPEKILLRMAVLLPVYRVKWVCIALNHFLAVDGERRRFAKGNEEMHFAAQLRLAENLLSSIHV